MIKFFGKFLEIGSFHAKTVRKFSTEQILGRLVHQLSTLWPFLTSNPFPKMFLDFVFFTPKFNYTYVFTSILGPTEPRSNHYNFQHRTFHPFWTLFPLFKRFPRTEVSQIVYTAFSKNKWCPSLDAWPNSWPGDPNFGTSTQVQNSSILDIFIIFEKSFCLVN